MDVSQYLADSPPTVVPLAIKPHFEAGLTDEQKLYAHHISKYVESLLVGHFFSVDFLNNIINIINIINIARPEALHSMSSLIDQ